MKALIQRVKNHIHHKLVKPIFDSVSPVQETALGTAIGLFVGLTPTVGLQMWIVFLIWLGSKYLLKVKFDLIVGTALVWISNPLTMFFLYYGFLATGYHFLTVSGLSAKPLVLSYTNFHDQLFHIVHTQEASSIEKIINGTRFLMVDLGYPMAIGSLFYAIPLSSLGYICVRQLLPRYRAGKAKKMGLNYERWQEVFERK